eukprot:8484077-Alexandrium_andersonii.AAC.1
MSASLVGSEMCIRDRARSPPKPDDAGCIGVDRSPAGEDSTLLHEGGTVSYTHLTLPTICSV